MESFQKKDRYMRTKLQFIKKDYRTLNTMYLIIDMTSLCSVHFFKLETYFH
ncbi:hypothetical protein RchiOBHm_Chr7g0192291 [Rosa chinensis]|uniref:Uncharacterized protein n=1 Tax=Rosa chinensis TaxID=74649 RepID=A0A2P6P5J3_ROSCH|nr:hypothetical protein RchiOBHm_Chr7g0192291 [Rosa chinensis]